MVSKERMKQLVDSVTWWRGALFRAEQQRESLLKAEELGISITDDDGKDILPDRIMQEDTAAKAYHKGLILAESLLGRAQHGQDV